MDGKKEEGQEKGRRTEGRKEGTAEEQEGAPPPNPPHFQGCEFESHQM